MRENIVCVRECLTYLVDEARTKVGEEAAHIGVDMFSAVLFRKETLFESRLSTRTSKVGSLRGNLTFFLNILLKRRVRKRGASSLVDVKQI